MLWSALLGGIAEWGSSSKEALKLTQLLYSMGQTHGHCCPLLVLRALTGLLQSGHTRKQSSVNPPTDSALGITESTLGTQPSPANNVSPTASNSSVTTQGFNYSWTSSGKDIKNSSWMPSETYSPFPSGAGSTLHGDDFISTTKEFPEVPTTDNRSTKNNDIHITVIVAKKPKDGTSWPVLVAALLFLCLVSFGLGVRKWCQYQQEIMERPPPFKPPPPPIKYTCIQESIGSDLPCHEMEAL
ncbi:T-cell surface protein tactile [Myotis brandtii]|uniref:T-cell surface protein tactile n=1 Tax=Myotis brandtii TaxID=109478 RepID=S7PHR3_MYOBR|nr:T-cell surface protein tactile [Myotis brandtii]